MVYNARIICSVAVPSIQSLPPTSVAVQLEVRDPLTKVSGLCQQLSQHLGSSYSDTSNVRVHELRWKGGICNPANPLDLYFDLDPSATKEVASADFTATASAVPKYTKCTLRIIDRSGRSGNDNCTVELDVGSPYITVKSLEQQVLEALPGVQTYDLSPGVVL